MKSLTHSFRTSQQIKLLLHYKYTEYNKKEIIQTFLAFCTISIKNFYNPYLMLYFLIRVSKHSRYSIITDNCLHRI